MGRFPVTQLKEDALEREMAELGIREGDLDEQFVRSPGPGGQKVNKTASAVRVRHRPTGIEAKCSESRSQGLNRFLARRRLVERYRSEILGELSPRANREQQRAAKAKKQKQRRARRTRRKSESEKPEIPEKPEKPRKAGKVS